MNFSRRYRFAEDSNSPRPGTHVTVGTTDAWVRKRFEVPLSRCGPPLMLEADWFPSTQLFEHTSAKSLDENLELPDAAIITTPTLA